jgi:hypothetical protein
MSGIKRFVLLILGVASGMSIAWLMRQRSREIGGLHTWRQVLFSRHGVPAFDSLYPPTHPGARRCSV